MNALAQEYRETPVTEIQPHPKNVRRGNVEAIADSVEKNGFVGTIVVQRSTGYILIGNHRYRAAVKLGHTSVPCMFVDVDDQRALKILLADNRTHDLGQTDMHKLIETLQSVDDLLGTGFDNKYLESLQDRGNGWNCAVRSRGDNFLTHESRITFFLSFLGIVPILAGAQ